MRGRLRIRLNARREAKVDHVSEWGRDRAGPTSGDLANFLADIWLGPGDAVRASSDPYKGIGRAGRERSLPFEEIRGILGLGGVELEAWDGVCGRRWMSLVMAMARRTSMAIAEEGGKEGEKEEVAARQRNVMRLGPARYVEGRRRCDYIMFGPILPRVPPRPPPRSPPRFFIHTVMSVTSPNS